MNSTHSKPTLLNFAFFSVEISAWGDIDIDNEILILNFLEIFQNLGVLKLAECVGLSTASISGKTFIFPCNYPIKLPPFPVKTT